MKSKCIRKLALRYRADGKSYNEISDILDISKECARHLCRYKIKSVTIKRGPKCKLNGLDQFRLRKEVQNIKMMQQKVTTTKIMKNCKLNISQQQNGEN